MIKKRNNRKGNLYSIENRLSRNHIMWCAADNHNYMCHICAKDFYIRTLIKWVLTNYQIFTKLPHFTLFTKNGYFYIGFPRVFQTFFIHFHSKSNSISSRKMSLNKSQFQFQTCFKQFQTCVIMFQTFFIDFRRFDCLIRPIMRRVVNRGSKFVLCHLYSNFFH